MKFLTSTKVYLFILFICSFSIAYAMYGQYVQMQVPCPICIAQRVIFILIAVISIIALLHRSKGIMNRLYALVIIGLAGFGIKTAYHHWWLQHLPKDQLPLSCGMPLEIYFKQVPLTGFIQYILSGSAECANITWNVFGLNPALAVMLVMVVIAVLAITVLFKKSKTKKDGIIDISL